jgi:hypothetical protein
LDFADHHLPSPSSLQLNFGLFSRAQNPLIREGRPKALFRSFPIISPSRNPSLSLRYVVQHDFLPGSSHHKTSQVFWTPKCWVAPQDAQAPWSLRVKTNKYRNEILQHVKSSNEPGFFTLLNVYGALSLGSTYTVINAHSVRPSKIFNEIHPIQLALNAS